MFIRHECHLLASLRDCNVWPPAVDFIVTFSPWQAFPREPKCNSFCCFLLHLQKISFFFLERSGFWGETTRVRESGRYGIENEYKWKLFGYFSTNTINSYRGCPIWNKTIKVQKSGQSLRRPKTCVSGIQKVGFSPCFWTDPWVCVTQSLSLTRLDPKHDQVPWWKWMKGLVSCVTGLPKFLHATQRQMGLYFFSNFWMWATMAFSRLYSPTPRQYPSPSPIAFSQAYGHFSVVHGFRWYIINLGLEVASGQLDRSPGGGAGEAQTSQE